MWWSVTGALAVVAVASGLADRRQRSRIDPDRIGWIYWPGVQLFTIAGAVIALSLALHA